MREDFLWGGSIAAHQCEGAWREGGKGTAIMDLVTSGSHEVPREICKEIEDGKYYPCLLYTSRISPDTAQGGIQPDRTGQITDSHPGHDVRVGGEAPPAFQEDAEKG